ncbi:MAG: hypothetical protein ACREUD_00720 [Gammaproteobacteria bacterium]
MDKELFNLLFLAFVPGIALVIAGVVSAVRHYGAVFLWCLRFEPLREKLLSMLREMHPVTAVVTKPEHDGQSEPGTVAL